MARPKNQEIRQKILKSAYSRFMTTDYNEIYLKDIAAECGISTALLHHYFPAKSDLVIHIIYDLLFKVEQMMEEQPELYVNKYVKGVGAYNHILVSLFMDILTRNNDQMLRVYSYVLCDARLIHRVVDFSLEYLNPYAALKDTYEKRFGLYIFYGSLSQTVLLYLENKLLYSFPEAIQKLYERNYYSYGLTPAESNELTSYVNSVVTEEFKATVYQRYMDSLDRFVACDWKI